MAERKTIVCYGDSNTYGYDPRSGTGDRYPKDVRWTGILAGQTGADIRNHGVNGRCIPHTASQLRFACEQIEGWASEENSPRIWIMLGTNDILQEPAFKAEDVADRMRKFLEKLRELPSVNKLEERFFLIAPPYMEYGAWVNEERIYRESRRLGGAYQKLAEELNIPFADSGKWGIPVVFDGVHFSEQGHRVFAENAAHILIELG